MANHRRQWALAILLALLVAAARPVAAAPACDDLAQAVPIRLIAAHPSATDEQTATREEMDRIADRIGASSPAREAHPLMLSIAQAGTHVELPHHAIERQSPDGQEYACDVPASVVVVVGAFKNRVILHHDAAAVPCVRAALLEHHRGHSHFLDAQIDLFVDEHRDDLIHDVRALIAKAAPNSAAAIRDMETGLASLVGRLYRQYEVAIERSRQEADSPSALDQLRDVCDGKVRELERALTGPVGKRAALDPTAMTSEADRKQRVGI